MIEELFYDKTRDSASSQPRIKSGPNMGLRHVEKGGKWFYMTGHTSIAGQAERSINFTWANKLIELGFRVGRLEFEGCSHFYVFQADKS